MLLHAVHENGSFSHGSIKKICEHFEIDRKTVGGCGNMPILHVWTVKLLMWSFLRGKKNCGRRLMYFPHLVKSAV